jgi:UDP-N-acetylmuramoyl-L-alanyl-D-glutamate--2,6-diaminopimelate ligase
MRGSRLVTITLSRLAAVLPQAESRGDAELTDATHDSRQAGKGSLFCAIVGHVTDGHDHASDAVANGASGLLVQRWLELDVPQVRVPDSRAATGPAAAEIHGHPSQDMAVVGITGTNGKTTTAYLVEGAFAAAGRGTGLIGTVETRIHGRAQPGVRTTPEGPDVQRLLARMRDRGVEGVAMEVSSHGLDLHRVDGTRYAVAVFTNLSQDHLDFHPDMEAYFRAKARLFTPEFADRAVVVVDDDWGKRLAASRAIDTVTVGRAGDADVRVADIELGLDGGRAVLRGDLVGGSLPIQTRLVGDFNVMNAAAGVVAAIRAGVPAAAAVEGVAACPGAPGRLERVPGSGDITVLVDYAHTPDAVERVVATLRPLLGGGRLIMVLGAGGDRDRTKRPLMGAAAAAADVAVLTSDNPRTEDPQAILDAVVQGAEDAGTRAQIVQELDRRRAIAEAVERARPGDVVVIAGKGHEPYQELASGRIDFDDRIVAAEVLAASQAGDR